METMRQASSLAELKKAYRKLAFENHPDRGGSEEKMKAINAEFEKLYEQFKKGTYQPTEKDYEDYGSDTAKEYTSHVYNEYSWEGSRYDSSLSRSEICKKIKEYGAQRFPTCKFSVTKDGWRSINVHLMSGDFEAWADASDEHRTFNEYNASSEQGFTPRCHEVLRLMTEYANSYNYDNSDIMTDYFDVNFYLTVEVGKWDKAYVNTAKIVAGEKYVKTPTEKRIQKAVGANNWIFKVTRSKREGYFLCERADIDKVYALTYSQPSVIKNRMAKMEEAGLEVAATGWNLGSIEVKNWNEIEEQIEREREQMKQEKASEPKAEEKPVKQGETIAHGKVVIIDYSEKAIAVVGDTKPLKDQLKMAGGKFNPRLTCGAGWIFSKTRRNDVEDIIRKAC
ncbi:MAG: hypothetical protein PUF10_02790 [Bacteroidales bacterium]|nr:hypothetical protein [Bacteroidales bacterium]